MKKWLVSLSVLIFATMVMSACTRKATDNIPTHPKAVVTSSACPSEAMSPDDVCYHIPGVTVSESIQWYKDKLLAQGWAGPAEPPDDEPFPYNFAKNGRTILLIFQNFEGGTSLNVTVDLE